MFASVSAFYADATLKFKPDGFLHQYKTNRQNKVLQQLMFPDFAIFNKLKHNHILDKLKSKEILFFIFMIKVGRCVLIDETTGKLLSSEEGV